MANASKGSIDLASLLRTNKVEALLATVLRAPGKCLVWTRFREDNSSWIINVSDGIDLWHLCLDQEQLDSHRELVEIDKYETYFARFKSDFESGAITLTRLPNKVTLTVGTGFPSLSYELYEAKASEKKTELQTILFRLADEVSELTDQLKESSDSLEKLKNQKHGVATGSTIFDIPPKKANQTLPVKRKQGNSLINPGSRKESAVGVRNGNTTENSVHVSVLGSDQVLDIFKCENPTCEHLCTKTNKRYHCPLCNNKPQKPGRMRRHFEKMHSGKQIVQHGGYQMLRCKLKCTKTNGRITDNSHYHCCLCGRVLVRKVHLYCHLQAHAVGSIREIDEMLDAKEDSEEGPLEDTEMDDENEDDTTLDTSQLTRLQGPEQDNVVALSSGTQVVFVQSLQDSETLTVLPLDEQSNTLALTQQAAGHAGCSNSVINSSNNLSAGLQVLSPGSSSLDSVQRQLPQGLTVKQVEAMLNQGGENTEHVLVATEHSESNLPNLREDEGGIQTYTTEGSRDIDMEADRGMPGHCMSKQVQDEAMEYEPCLQEADLHLPAASSNKITGSNMANVPSLGQSNIQLGQVEQAISSQAPSQLITSSPDNTIQTSELRHSMVSPISKPLFDEEATSQHTQAPKAKPVRQDSLVLVDAASCPKEDDQVFKVLLNNLSPASSCVSHPSVLNEKDNLDIRRCRNTFCDCRLYHCPLCTCLPNKPGRIREHFKKIHAQDLVIRYQGFQMLRCKLGCSRPTGTKVLNSHYHCCICGTICIRKSGVYEHMRINHSSEPLKKYNLPSLSQDIQEKQVKHETGPKPFVVQVPTIPAETSGIGNQPQVPPNQGTVPVSTTPQTVTVQLPQQGGGEGQGQQQLVILMPQQINQSQVQSPVPAQQPIVIVMPQTGGAQVAQPIVVPVPQISNT